MIAFMPTPYEDELLYSVFARYLYKSGYIAYRFAAEDLYSNPTTRPDVEFINNLTKDAYTAITKSSTIQDVILKHTMFPYYARFLELKKRQESFYLLVNTQSGYRTKLSVSRNKSDKPRNLRYCPICAEYDRKKYGETYWHRKHQMIGINICPIHFCELKESEFVIRGKASPSLISAEEHVPFNSNAIFYCNDIDIQIAKYVNAVFQSDIDMTSDVLIGDFLHHKMIGTKYLSVRGEQKNVSLLHNDYMETYNKSHSSYLTEVWRLQKVFTNNYHLTYDICLVSMFLHISVEELTAMELPDKPAEQMFDEKVQCFRKQGMTYPQIALLLKAPLETVKSSGKNKSNKHSKQKDTYSKPRAKRLDWIKLDIETLPKVAMAINLLKGDNSQKPKRVTINAVENILSIPCKRIENMPLCKAEILKHYETQPEYWAKEVVWAANKLSESSIPLSWRNIRQLTNMRKENLIDCYPYLEKTADPWIIKAVKLFI